MKKEVKIYGNPVFAERFRTLMSNRNVRLEDIAEVAGCAVSTASTWRRGRMPRNTGTLKKIADFLSVDAAFLSGNTPHVSGEMGEPVFSNCAESPLAGEIRSHVERLIGLSDEPLLEKLKRELEKNFPVVAATEFADRK